MRGTRHTEPTCPVRRPQAPLDTVVIMTTPHEEGFQCLRTISTEKKSPFSSMSKRRRGFPSESRVKRGDRVVHGDKELIRKAWAQRSMSVWIGAPLSRTVA
jgi:hypothetical protein